MPSPRSLRPIIFPSARRLPPTPPSLPYRPIIHQHHHGRTTATLRSFSKSRNFVSLVGSAIAAKFGIAFWLHPQQSDIIYARYVQFVEKHIKPKLYKVFQEYLGCHNIQVVAQDRAASKVDIGDFADMQVAMFLDADAASESLEGSIDGFALSSTTTEELELLVRSQKVLNNMNR